MIIILHSAAFRDAFGGLVINYSINEN